MRLTLLLIAACVAVAAASAPRHHKWVRMGLPVDPHTPVTVYLAVKHGVSFGTLADKCDAVSNPKSATYGDYLSVDQVKQFLGSEPHARAVASYLIDAGATDVDTVATGDFVQATLTAAAVSSMFGVPQLEVFGHPSTPAQLMRSVERFVLPAALEAHVDTVVGVSDFPPIRAAPGLPTSADMDDDDDGGYYFTLSIAAIGNDTAWLYMTYTNTSLPSIITKWTADISVDGAAATSVNVPLSQVTLGDNQGLIVLTDGLSGDFHRYSINLTAFDAAGNGYPVRTSLPTASGREGLGDGVMATPFVTPDYLRAFYNTTGVDVSTRVEGNSQAVAEFGGEFMNPKDLQAYFSKFGVEATGNVSYVGPNNVAAPGLESSMDIQLLMALAPNVDTVFWSVAMGSSLNGSWVLEWAIAMSNTASPPLITSISYGLPEYLLPEYFDDAYGTRMNEELIKLCMRGVTVVVCSQDAGATDDGHGADNCNINPVFPSSSPWVTAVSSTLAFKGEGVAARPGRTDGVGEAVVSLPDGCLWTTGSGFSDQPTSRQPAYQASAVQGYLSSGVRFPEVFNKTGRAYPDISSLGRNYPIVLDGHFLAYGDGTSASTPVVSGLLSLVNSARIQAGKPALGFVNPLLYSLFESHPEVYYDVTHGETRCGAFMCCPVGSGFYAAKGYDVASGLGTIGDFPAFLTAAVNAA